MSATNNNEKKSCKDQIRAEYQGRIDEIRDLWESSNRAYNLTEEQMRAFVERHDCESNGPQWDESLERQQEIISEIATDRFSEYGLSWDYVAPGTFDGQRRGYFRWQLSWGGPSEEFRFFVDENFGLCRVEFWYLDWFDGARRVIRRGSDYDLLNEIWENMKEMDMPRHWMGDAE